MKPKSVSQVLREVDPGLTVIGRRPSTHHRGKKVIKLNEVSTTEFPSYTPYRSSDDDWNNTGGLRCPRCGQETVRFIRGVCLVCARKAEERTDEEIEMEALSRSLREQRARNRR